ncbi:MAG: WD40/YVTN/BNR-like repeat-containing protein, partial [Candidatus Binatia bacterium]
MAASGKNALHLATHSGWYRYERRGENWQQTDRALTFWQMSCIQVAPDNPKHVYAGTEHSGMFITKDGGKDWMRAEPNVPILEMSAMLALPGKVLVGTRPAALYMAKNGSGWQEVKGIR